MNKTRIAAFLLAALTLVPAVMTSCGGDDTTTAETKASTDAVTAEVTEPADALEARKLVDDGVATKDYNGAPFRIVTSDGKSTQYIVEAETGDVVAVFSGHDHPNSYTVTKNGVDIVNTPGASFESYGDNAVRGLRLITINEEDTWSYETEVLTVAEYILNGGEHLVEYGEITKLDAVLGIMEKMFFELYIKFVQTLFFFM